MLIMARTHTSIQVPCNTWISQATLSFSNVDTRHPAPWSPASRFHTFFSVACRGRSSTIDIIRDSRISSGITALKSEVVNQTASASNYSERSTGAGVVFHGKWRSHFGREALLMIRSRGIRHANVSQLHTKWKDFLLDYIVNPQMFQSPTQTSSAP